MASPRKSDPLIEILLQIQARKTVRPEEATKALAQYQKVQEQIKALKKETELFKANRALQSSVQSDTKDQPAKTTNNKTGSKVDLPLNRRESVPSNQRPSASIQPIVNNDVKAQNAQRRSSVPVPSPGYKHTTNTKQTSQDSGSIKTKQINQPDNVTQTNDSKQANGALARRISGPQSPRKENKVIANTSSTTKGKEQDPLQSKLAQQAKNISEKDQELARLRFQNAQLKVAIDNRNSTGQQSTDTKSIVSTSDHIDFPPPQKLVVDFKVIHDNEWKSAFHELEKHYKLREEVITELLAAVAKEAYTFCQAAAKQQYEDITKSHAYVIDVLVQPRYVSLANKDVVKPKSKAIIDKDGHQATKKFLRQYRRAMARVPVSGLIEMCEGIVQKDVLSRHLSLRTTPKSLRPYIHRLVEVGWLMAISEPPVYQLWLRGGQLMPRDTYIAYDKKGATVIHTVWPALLMYKDGPLADRGVCLVK